jgi:mono/diheme cytochrome c family protein
MRINIDAALAPLALAIFTALAGPAQAAPSDGATLFANQCASCHAAAPGEAPEKAVLAQKTPDAVVQALTTGSMQYMAAGLSPEDIRAIAVYLTGKAPSPSAPGASTPAAPGATPK